MRARLWHGTVAVLVAVGLAIQTGITVRAPGTPEANDVGTLAGTIGVARLVRMLSFFTIQSNILCGLVSLQLAQFPDRDGRFWRVARLDAVVGITVTGIVYSTVLARIHEPKGWEQVSTNILFHYVVPIMMVLGWLFFGPRPRVDAHSIRWSLAWPLVWFAYTLAHGVTHWYPYPFVDVASQGYARVLVNALLVLAVLLGVALVFRWGDRRLGPTPPVEVPAEPGPASVGRQRPYDVR
ncbi:MAG TPA: Pr6Pr family membrane protein [Nocardioides sp.]|nr:Pr6Pr family membrane protein [Nocardioides sp.]